MSLVPGTRLGPYEIVAPLGAGGMGEVYRARDAKLNRDVALKILPATFATDPDRLARFRREAQVLASLNHPNIGHIYGFEDGGTTHALVLELIEGPTLADRIAAGPMSLADALPIAKQMAEALEFAHEQGIVHRDLKPANVKVREDGTVKVLDFGLAKALDPAAASSAEAMNSPTLTGRSTQFGVILGTAAYMAPEQAKGKTVDKRVDIWAFGAVLYEMLSGRRAFQGDDVSDTLAAVLKDTPSFEMLPASTPARLKRLLERCLERDPRQRLRDIGEARLEIAKIEAGAPDTPAVSAAAPAAAPPSAGSRVLPWAVAGVLGVALISTLLIWAPWRSAATPMPRTLLAAIGVDASLPTNVGAAAILSPDGTTLAFVAVQSGQPRLFVRKLDRLQSSALAGTEGAASPFFSPDGQWIAFFATGRLKKVSVTGGAPISLCDVPAGRGGTWTEDDTIIFSPNSTPNTMLMRVSAAGGTAVVLGTLSQGVEVQRWPQVLPGGKTVLYTEHSTTNNFDRANLAVAPVSGGPSKIVARGGYYGRYMPSGHLVYMRQNTLFAAPFDLSKLETIGPAAPALDGIVGSQTTGGAQLAFSSEGTLAYVPGATANSATPIDWMTRDGKTSVLRAMKAEWASPRFSPDGRKLALEINDGRQRDIWVYEWARDALTQLTFDPAQDRRPVWTPDGQRIVFDSDRGKAGVSNLYWVSADGTGDVTRLTDSPNLQEPFSWHPSARFLAFQEDRRLTATDLMILPIEGDASRGWTPGTPTVFLSTPTRETFPMFSPDGRWIAYAATVAGIADVYVRSFPGPGGPWRVSLEGGLYPRWAPTAHELLFVNEVQVMFAPYAVVGDSFRVEKPQVWSPTNFAPVPGRAGPYDLHSDGKRVAIFAARDQGPVVQDKIVFVFNFFDHLRKIAPGRK